MFASCCVTQTTWVMFLKSLKLTKINALWCKYEWLLMSPCSSFPGDTQNVPTKTGRSFQTTKKLLVLHFQSAQKAEGGILPGEKVSLHTHKNICMVTHLWWRIQISTTARTHTHTQNVRCVNVTDLAIIYHLYHPSDAAKDHQKKMQSPWTK